MFVQVQGTVTPQLKLLYTSYDRDHVEHAVTWRDKTHDLIYASLGKNGRNCLTLCVATWTTNTHTSLAQLPTRIWQFPEEVSTTVQCLYYVR
jgi:hypothetical protein